MGWDKPAIWVSDIGTRWQRLALPASVFADAHFSDVRATYVWLRTRGGTGTQSVSATGGPKENVPVMAAAWWSGDGRTWTRAAVQRQGGLGLTLGTVFVGSRGLVAVGSASGGNESVAWTSADGRTWQPIAPGYFGAPPASLGVPTLPSCTITDDGTHIVAVGVADQLAVRMWTSSDGVAWQPLPFSGATDMVPAWPDSSADHRSGLRCAGRARRHRLLRRVAAGSRMACDRAAAVYAVVASRATAAPGGCPTGRSLPPR